MSAGHDLKVLNSFSLYSFLGLHSPLLSFNCSLFFKASKLSGSSPGIVAFHASFAFSFGALEPQ